MTLFSRATLLLLAVAAFLIGSTIAGAQTFRGSLTGTVLDASGGAIPNAAVQLTNPATNEVLSSKTNGSGDFNFPELTVGVYKLLVSAPGFSTKSLDNIAIEVSKVNHQQIPLSIGSESTVVDVQASGVTVDTTTSSLVAVVDSKSVQEIPLNGRNFTQMIKLAPGVSPYSNTVNGSRTAGVNFQIDGADNNDPWSNAVASNQGGIAGVAGGLIPIEAIDQFSLQAAGEADTGRNGGANSNMVIKGGTNHLHGDVFYYDRNELFAWLSPSVAVGSRIPEIRNHQGGFTLGGPIFKDKTFFFVAGEVQIAQANNSLSDTVLNDTWITAGMAMLANHHSAVNPVATNMYTLLFPQVSRTTTGYLNQYKSNGVNTYNSYNGIIKLDHNFSDKYTISLRYLGTTGAQSADVGSHFADYFETAPMHIHNVSIVQNSTFNSKFVNQITFAASSFLQVFNDRNLSFDVQANGLPLGLTGQLAHGAPKFAIGSFDYTGATAPLGRQDVTGHVTDQMHYTLGRHDLKFGGEYRHANLNVAYFVNGRGTFTFDGTRGGWTNADCTAAGLDTGNASAAGANCSTGKQVADFLIGQTSVTAGAQILRNNPQRVYLVNTFDAYAADDFKVNNRLTLNYGARWSYPGTVNDDRNSIYNFTPQRGYFKAPLYARNLGNVAPRFGFAFTPFKDSTATVIRGNFGWFFDQPTVGQFVYNSIGNGASAGIFGSPGDVNAAINVSSSNYTLGTSSFPSGVSFGTNGQPTTTLGILAINPNYRAAYMQNYNLNLEQQLAKNTLMTIAYVGSVGRRLAYVADLNQIPVTTNAAARVRPYATQYPYLTAINQVDSGATSNYNSLQFSLKQAQWHGLSATLYYTWSKSLDDSSSATTPMNSLNLRQDWGLSTFDVRNNVSGFASYAVPHFTRRAPRLTQGYQVNALYSFAGGTPINVLVGTNTSGSGEASRDRPNRIPGVHPFVARATKATATARSYSYLNKAAWSTPVTGTFGNERRDSVQGPGFGDVDLSFFKRTPITERISTELRAEIFNVANQANFANPSGTLTSSAFGILSATRNSSSAPGLGAGEPRNMQFAFKVSF
jgi:Carboxypeptidase regulatory-like domain